MKITFLGTSHGVPAADRYCACNMIQVKDALYFIDAGAPLMDLLIRRGTDLSAIRAIFTTHMHGDHVNGVLAYADLVNWYFKNAKTQIYLTEEKGIRLFQELLEATAGIPLDTKRVQFCLAQQGLMYTDAHLRVTALPTRHMAHANRPSYAYLIEAEGKRVLFSGDLSGQLAEEDFPALALEEPLDLMILELAHFTVEQVTPYLARCKAKTLLINHASVNKLDQIAALDGQFGYPIRVLQDNDEVEL